MTATAARLRSTILCYWVGQSSTLIWVVRADGLVTTARVPVLASRLTDLVNEATGPEDGDTGSRGLLVTGGSHRRPWRELYRLLVAPVERALPAGASRRLTIVPHGPLFRLAFAGLRDEEGRYLIERFELHYVPAVAVLGYTARDRRSTGALLVADPGALPGDAGSELPALPWARREVDAIRHLVGNGATVLVGETASEGKLRESLAAASVLHVATHGIIRNDEALGSFLALRGDGASAETDGRLTADEVYSLRLDADVVVLSACRSALGPTTGDGVIGFTRAFLYAGASSVVATMWDVPDRTTYDVMKTFYERRRGGAAKSAALRAAQLALLGSLRRGAIAVDGVPLPESPRLWAGFVIVGEP